MMEPSGNIVAVMEHWEAIAALPEQEKAQLKLMKAYVKNRVDNGIDLNRMIDASNGYSPTHEVARKGYYNALIVFQKFGGDLNRQSPINGLTPRNLLYLKHPEKAG